MKRCGQVADAVRRGRIGAVAAIGTIAALVAYSAVAQAPAAKQYETRLTIVAVDALDSKNLRGDGRVHLLLDGNTATVSGSFTGLLSAATRARIFIGSAVGVPGKPVFDLVVSAAQVGTISGKLSLNAEQQQALRASRFYVQLDSVKGPEGTIWGWLMPAHPIPGQHVPEKQPWFASWL
jgi:hypothetical protein